MPKWRAETKTNIKSKIVERIRKGIFKMIKIHIHIKIKAAFKGYHLKLAFKVGLSNRENDNFSVFCHLLKILANLFIVHFYAHIQFVTTTSKIPLPSKETLLNNFSI